MGPIDAALKRLKLPNDHPRCDLDLVRLFCLSLHLPDFRTHVPLPLPSPTPPPICNNPLRAPCHTKPQKPRRYSGPPLCQLIDDPLPRNPLIPSPSPPGPRFPAFYSPRNVILLGNLWSPMRSSAPAPQITPSCARLLRYLTSGSLKDVFVEEDAVVRWLATASETLCIAHVRCISSECGKKRRAHEMVHGET